MYVLLEALVVLNDYGQTWDQVQDSPHCSGCLNVTSVTDKKHRYVPGLECDENCPNKPKKNVNDK